MTVWKRHGVLVETTTSLAYVLFTAESNLCKINAVPPTHPTGRDAHSPPVRVVPVSPMSVSRAWVDIPPSPGSDRALAAWLVSLTAFVVLLGRDWVFVWRKKGMPVVKILSVVLPARKQGRGRERLYKYFCNNSKAVSVLVDVFFLGWMGLPSSAQVSDSCGASFFFLFLLVSCLYNCCLHL